MKKVYNWGILGAGSIAHKFAGDLKLLPNAKLLAVGSRSSERARKFAAEHAIMKAYGTYEELVTDPELDVIYIASRHVGHYPDSMLCLEHGKAVLCEKPVAINRRQFERMIGLAAEKKLFFMEALWTRFIPSFMKCLEIVKSGLIGKVRLIESDFCFNPPYDPMGRLYNPLLGGGSLLDVGLYPVFLAMQMGSTITEIKAMAQLDGNNIDTSCTMLLSHEEGELSVLSSSIVTNGRVESIIHGNKGMVRLNRWWHVPTSVDIVLDGKSPENITFQEPGNGYQYEAEEVMKCLDEGKQGSDLWGRPGRG